MSTFAQASVLSWLLPGIGRRVAPLLLSIIIVTIATLSTTLSKAPAKTPTYTTSSGVAKTSNPYSRLGAQPSSALGGGNQSLYAALTQQQQMQRPTPSNEFSASYNFDPVLSKLAALGEQSIANARSEAAALKKQTLIGSGSDKFAQELGADQNTIDAAKQNSMGASQLLQKDFGDRSRQLDESLNAQNLFYSGERVRQMGDLEFGRAKAETDFGARLREVMAGIDQQLLAAEEAEQMRQIEAMIAAGGSGGFVGAGGAGVTPPGAAPIAEGPIGSMPSNWISSGPGMISGPGMVAPVTPPLVQPFPGGGTISDSWYGGAPPVAPISPYPVVDPYDQALAAALQGAYQRPVAI